MPLLPASDVKTRPCRVPIEGQTVGTSVRLKDLLKVLEFDDSRTVYVEEAKCDLVFGVGFCEEVCEVGPVGHGDEAVAAAVGDFEEDGILFAFYLVLLW